MIQTINDFFLSRTSGRRVLLWLALLIACLALFGLVLVPTFESATGGLRPVDLAFPTTPELIFSQLPFYTEASYRAYAWFAVLDYIYPPTLATFLAMLWAWFCTVAPNRFFDRLLAVGIVLLPFVGAALDWLENAGFLTVIFSYPAELRGIADLACGFKQAKLVVNSLNVLLTIVLSLTALFIRLRRPN
jgi:hypothetical protein